ncbi:protein jagged-1b-like isoform X2 [Oryza brachyantha]|uniref:protein jagged-1b-like isoform X2 n=1 Tax=Oryza brachyantha TaxID=4533 RepID=UPI0007767ACC|nr:protein jagged-1b-like isoform X2 [Oryza brachyantha]
MPTAVRAMIAAPPPPPRLLLLLGVVTVVVSAAAAVAGAAPACETANCGKGRCVEQPGPFGLDTYRCDCDGGWSNMFKLIPASPCTVPNCTFDAACFNLGFTPPRGIPLTDPCVFVSCGDEGQCVKDQGFSYHCACKPGYVNMLNLTMFPCIKNCAFGMDCSALGLSPPPPPPPPSSSSSSPSPAPPGNDRRDPSGPTAHPSSPKGYVSSGNLLQLLLLLSLAMAHIM